jgi:DNA-binding response OmpR family regulator
MPLSSPPGRKTILLVDDDSVARRSACLLLSAEGFRCFEADSAGEALEVLAMMLPGQVALVLVDVMMPKVDGIALVREIRRLWPWQRIAFFTAHPAEALRLKGLDLGEFHLIRAPFTREELLRGVAAALRAPPPGPG